MLSKEEIEKAYWEGYIAKQNEAMEICKQCKYIKKVKQLESREQKLIEKLEEESKQLEHDILTMSIDTGNNYSLKLINEAKGMKKQNDRILEILKKR